MVCTLAGEPAAGIILVTAHFDKVRAGAAHKNTTLGNTRAMVNNPGTAKAPRIPVDGMNVNRVGNTVTAPFRDKKVPVIDFHSLNDKTILTLQPIDGQLSAVSSFSELP